MNLKKSSESQGICHENPKVSTGKSGNRFGFENGRVYKHWLCTSLLSSLAKSIMHCIFKVMNSYFLATLQIRALPPFP